MTLTKRLAHYAAKFKSITENLGSITPKRDPWETFSNTVAERAAKESLEKFEAELSHIYDGLFANVHAELDNINAKLRTKASKRADGDDWAKIKVSVQELRKFDRS